MRPCHTYFLSFHIQNKVFHFTPLDAIHNRVPLLRRDPKGEMTRCHTAKVARTDRQAKINRKANATFKRV